MVRLRREEEIAYRSCVKMLDGCTVERAVFELMVENVDSCGSVPPRA